MSPFTKPLLQFSVLLYQLSGGVLGGHLGRATVLLLTTTGRKTGKQRITPLRYLREGDDYMIAASNWGKEPFPAWFHNLQANPKVTIQIMGNRMPAQAEVASTEEQDSLYQKFIEADRRFIGYRETAHRIIPVVLLHPQK